jgi:hypothetical protein
MWHRTFIAVLLLLSSTFSFSAGQNFPGDTLAAGQQFASTSMSVSDWYYAADFIGNASLFNDEGEPIEDTDRGFFDASNKGYDFTTYLTYMFGLSNDITLGLRYGYIYQKDESDIFAPSFSNLTGDWKTEGGTDLTLLGKYRLDQTTSADFSVQLPICSSSSVSELCNSKPAIPENSQQSGRSGGQGSGYYQVSGGLSSHWLTALGTHWMGSLFASATVADDVFGEKVSAPFIYGASFGGIFPLRQNHQWTGTIRLQRNLSYDSYSVQLQEQVNYSESSILSFRGEYLWDFMTRVQLRPYAEFAIDQLPTQSFVTNGEKRTLEYTAGTRLTIGAELRATF